MHIDRKNRPVRSGSRGRGGSFSRSATRNYGGRNNDRPRGRSRNFNRRGNNKRGGRGKQKQPSFDPSRFINTNPIDPVPEVYTPQNNFSTFGLNDQLVRTVTSLKMVSPTPIQDKVIPEIMAGRDVIGLAETGTGKTAAFLLPLIEKTLNNPSRRTLILTPTRELALQIEEEFRSLARGLKLYAVTCVGGVNIRPQISSLRRTNHFVIGTPGRMIDLIDRGHFKPSTVSTVVLDEADRMLDMGFINDMRTILKTTPKDRETLFFSATMNADAQKIVNDFLIDPVSISVKKKDVADSIEQDIVPHDHDSKFDTLTNLLARPEFERVLIFGAMKHSVEKLSKQLSARNLRAESIHGNKNHSARQRALKKFKNGDARVLVATDVAARGIHVEDVSHVINYDLPNTFEDYVHRIGRTGRGSKRGKALTFVPTRS